MLSRESRATLLVGAAAMPIGGLIAAVTHATWEGTLAASGIYGGAATLMLALAKLKPIRRRRSPAP